MPNLYDIYIVERLKTRNNRKFKYGTIIAVYFFFRDKKYVARYAKKPKNTKANTEEATIITCCRLSESGEGHYNQVKARRKTTVRNSIY